jgi:hypothetical protein
MAGLKIPTLTSEALNSEGAVVCAPGVCELPWCADQGPVLPPAPQVGDPFARARVGRAVAQPAVLVAHHCAHEPAARRRAATKKCGNYNFFGGKRDFVKKRRDHFFWREIQIVISLLNRRMFSVVGYGSTLCL